MFGGRGARTGEAGSGGIRWDVTPIMENQMESKMENEMEALGRVNRLYGDTAPILWRNKRKRK